MATTEWGLSKKIGKPTKWVSKHNAVSIRVTKEMSLDALFEDSFWQGVMNDYLRQELLPEMARRWRHEESETLNYPQTITATHTTDPLDKAQALSGTESNEEDDEDDYQRTMKSRKQSNAAQETARKDMRQGFRDLFSALTTKVPIASMPGFGLGPMAEVESLQLSQYMPHAGGGTGSKSAYNSLFYAIEFGTGMLAGWDEGQAGNPSYIRTEGDTKDPRAKYRGAWWLGRPGLGILWKGQQGAHFLFDARTRDPQQHWREFLQSTLPNFIRKRVGQSSEFGKSHTVLNNPRYGS